MFREAKVKLTSGGQLLSAVYPHVFTVNPRARIHGRNYHNIKFQGQHRFWSNVHVRKQEAFSVQTMRRLISIYTNTLKV